MVESSSAIDARACVAALLTPLLRGGVKLGRLLAVVKQAWDTPAIPAAVDQVDHVLCVVAVRARVELP